MTYASYLKSPRSLLIADALSCLSMAGLLLAVPEMLEIYLNIPARLSIGAGLLLLPVAAFMAVLGIRQKAWVPGLWLVIAGNGLWTIASLALVLTDWIAPNGLGVGFILVQALFVTAITSLEIGAARSMAEPRGKPAEG